MLSNTPFPVNARTHCSPSYRFACACAYALALLLGTTLSAACLAQNAPESLKNFKKYPNGEWLQESRRTDAAGAGAPPFTNKGCKSATDPKESGSAMKLNSALASFCKMVKINDTEHVFEYEQTCKINGTDTQLVRITGRAIDDKTMTVETRLRIEGQADTVTQTKMTYTGTACTKPVAAKLSAADCVQLAAGRAESSSGSDVCVGMQAQDRTVCEAQVAAGRKAFGAVTERCR